MKVHCQITNEQGLPEDFDIEDPTSAQGYDKNFIKVYVGSGAYFALRFVKTENRDRGFRQIADAMKTQRDVDVKPLQISA